MTPRFVPAALAAALAFASPCFADEASPLGCQPPVPVRQTDDQAYASAIRQAASMVSDPGAQRLAQEHGLQVLNVTWEDTGRSKGSAYGPNISDMTIQVGQTCMPVIRHPNFSDTTADVALDAFQVMVGNERGQPLRRVSLRELLANLRRYLTLPTSWGGAGRSLVSERDSHALVSAQACFLPVPRSGDATFNPVIFNYQSRAGDPAVLTILVTREGTSVTVTDPARGGERWGSGQRLFFNQAGQRASFTGQRLSDFQASGQTASNGAALVKGDPAGGLNQVLLIQVPLKQKAQPARETAADCVPCAPPACAPAAEGRRRGGDVEEAVVGHGKVEGPFTELGGLAIERDERFPIRVTVQLYKATSDGIVTPKDLSAIKAQLDAIYAKGDAVGSLVTDGPTSRPTEAYATSGLPAWWAGAWAEQARASGRPVAELQARLLDAMGEWVPSSPAELEAALRQLDLLAPRVETCGTIERMVEERKITCCGTGGGAPRSRTTELAAKAVGGLVAAGAALFALTRLFG